MDPNDPSNMAAMLQDLMGGMGGMPAGGQSAPRGNRPGGGRGQPSQGRPTGAAGKSPGDGGMPDLGAVLGAMGPNGMPDFDKLGSVVGMDSAELKGHAQRLWKFMDNLHESNPDGYKDFLAKQAKNAGMPEPFADGSSKEGGGASADPVAAAAAAVGMGGGMMGAPKPEAIEKATFLMPLTQTPKPGSKQTGDLGVVSIFRAKSGDAAADGALLPLPDAGHPVKVRSRKAPYADKVPPPTDDAHGMPLPPLGAAKASGLADATVYEVEVHADAITKALDDLRFQAILLESAIMHVEREHVVVMDRKSRRVYTHRGDATPTMAAAAAAQAASAAGNNMSSSLLTELAGITAAGKSGGGGGGGGGKFGGKGGGGGGGLGTGKPLIQEVAPEVPKHSVQVKRDPASGAPVEMEVTVELPSLKSIADADLQVTSRYVHLTPAPGAAETCVALPVPIDEESVSAKFRKKEGRLVIRATPLAAAR